MREESSEYEMALQRRQAAVLRSPLNALLHDPILDGPRRAVEPHVAKRLGVPLVTRPFSHHKSNRSKPHSGPIVTTKDESFCGTCGVGADTNGFYSRGVTDLGAPVLAEQLAALQHYPTEREAVRAAEKYRGGLGRHRK